MFLKRLLTTLIFVAVCFLPTHRSAAGYPGEAYFGYACGTSQITFYYLGNPAFSATFSQIAPPLASAITTGANQPILIDQYLGLWALTSNELQLHLNHAPDATKIVWRADICGPIFPAYGAGSASALAIAQVNGAGEVLAYAKVDNAGNAVAFAAAQGDATALAYAQSSGSSGNSGGPTNSGNPTLLNGVRVHVVQKGDTLYSIARRYGTTVRVLAALNGIINPNLIKVGQQIRLP